MHRDGAAHDKPGWLKILHDEDGSSWAYCPYRAQVLGAVQCFACKDCSGLAMDAAARDDYVVCDRAERDGYSTSVSAERDEDGSVHVHMMLTVRPSGDDPADE